MTSNLLSFILEFNVVLTAFYLVYLIFFRKDGNFETRRTWLFSAMILSLLLPLINVQLQLTGQGNSLIVFSLEEVVVRAGAGNIHTSSALPFIQLIPLLYLIIAAVLFARLLLVFFRIMVRRWRSKRIRYAGVWVRKNEALHASSFFGTVFLDPERMDPESGKQILAHELYHVKKWHSIDRVLSEIILALGWINPVAWMMRRSVIGNHEFQADNNVIRKGTDQVSYQLTLLNQYIGSASTILSNQFSNQIKNRINMLNKKNTRGSAWKFLLIIPVSLTLFLFVSCGNEVGDNAAMDESPVGEEELFYVVEEMPRWHDGTDMAMGARTFIAENLIYPKEAIEHGVQGRVFIQFIVNKEGKVGIPDPKSLPPELENGNVQEVVVVGFKPINENDEMPDEKYVQLLKDEAVRVVSEIPQMIPGKQDGKPVNVVFTMPISFMLQ